MAKKQEIIRVTVTRGRDGTEAARHPLLQKYTDDEGNSARVLTTTQGVRGSERTRVDSVAFALRGEPDCTLYGAEARAAAAAIARENDFPGAPYQGIDNYKIQAPDDFIPDLAGQFCPAATPRSADRLNSRADAARPLK